MACGFHNVQLIYFEVDCSSMAIYFGTKRCSSKYSYITISNLYYIFIIDRYSAVVQLCKRDDCGFDPNLGNINIFYSLALLTRQSTAFSKYRRKSTVQWVQMVLRTIAFRAGSCNAYYKRDESIYTARRRFNTFQQPFRVFLDFWIRSTQCGLV